MDNFNGNFYCTWGKILRLRLWGKEFFVMWGESKGLFDADQPGAKEGLMKDAKDQEEGK